jgi:hypothetical protein
MRLPAPASAVLRAAFILTLVAGPWAPATAQDLIHDPVRPVAETSLQVVLDSPQPLRQLNDNALGSYYRLTGWAADVTGPGSTGVRQVVAFADGPSGRGRLLGWARYGLPRPDVATALNNPAVTACGFELLWRVADLPLQSESVRQVALYLYLDTPQGWVLARAPLAISIWADSGL